MRLAVCPAPGARSCSLGVFVLPRLSGLQGLAGHQRGEVQRALAAAELDPPYPSSPRISPTSFPSTSHFTPGQGFPNTPRYFISEGLTPSYGNGKGGQDQSGEPHREQAAAPALQAVYTT